MGEDIHQQAGDDAIQIGRARDIIHSIFITGDHNQVFVGDYERLRDVYIEPWSVFERVNLDHFVGREWLLAEVDAFLRDHDRGYFILEAEAGLGKTTFLAWLVRERGYIHHFTELAPGLDGVGRGLKNLAAQLVLAYHLSAYEAEGVLSGAAARPDYLLKLLKHAADQRQDGEEIVLVVDALDEVGTPPGQNVLGLPQVLPEGVFIIVSQRPVPVTLQVDAATTPRRPFHLAADSYENQDDMRRFLERAATWPGITQALEEGGDATEQFVTTLLEKCRGVWIYLHYVIHEIERGERSPLDLNALPDGMTQYYARYWQRWRDDDKWYEVYLPLLTTLAAAQEALTLAQLCSLAGVTERQGLGRLLQEEWRPFLAVGDTEDGPSYRLYHASLREFLDGRTDLTRLVEAERSLAEELAQATRQAHARVADRYLDAWGGVEANLPGLQDPAKRDMDSCYGLRHLAAHLTSSERTADLHHLLRLEWVHMEKVPYTHRGLGDWVGRFLGRQRVSQHHRYENAWYVAKKAIGDTDGYRVDVERAWRLAKEGITPLSAEERGQGREGLVQALGLQLRYDLIIASLNSLVKNIPPRLLTALVDTDILSHTEGLAYARTVPDPVQRTDALTELATHLPKPLQGAALRDALATTQAIRSYNDQVAALVKLAPHLPQSLWEEAVTRVEAIGYATECVAGLVNCLPDQLRDDVLHEALLAARRAENGYWRARRLTDLVPYLPKPKREQVLQETLAAAQVIKVAEHRAEALIKLASNLPKSERAQVLQKALAVTMELPAKKEDFPLTYPRFEVLTELIPYLPEPLRSEALQKAITDARAFPVKAEQHDALLRLASHLDVSLLKELLDAVREVTDGYRRAKIMVKLAPHLPESLLRRALETVWSGEGQSCRDALTRLALSSHMREPLRNKALRRALVATRRLGSASDRASGLAELAPNLDEPLKEEVLQEALAATREMADADERAKVLAELTPELLSRPLSLKEALMVAQQIGDEWSRMYALSVPLKGEALEKALGAARALPSRYERANALVALAPRIPKRLGEKVLREALWVTLSLRDIWPDEWVASDLARLAPHLSGLLKSLALWEVLRIVREESRAGMLVEIAPHLSGLLLLRALVSILMIPYANSRVMALTALMPRLPKVLRSWGLRMLLAATRKVGDEELRVRALTELVPHLPEGLKNEALQEVLVAARGISKADDRARALIKLVPHLPEGLKNEALQKVLAAARGISKADDRARALIKLVPHLPEPLRLEASWDALVAAREIRWHNTRLDALVELLPHLLEPMKGQVLREVLGTAEILGSYDRARVLTKLSPQVPEPLLIESLQEALNVVRKLPEGKDVARGWGSGRYPRIEALLELTPYLPDPFQLEALSEALATARKIVDADERSEVIAKLASPLAELAEYSPPVLYPVWSETLHVLATRTRRDLLSDLHTLEPVLSALGGTEAVTETFRAIQDVGRWWP
jgi:hypothetical protein